MTPSEATIQAEIMLAIQRRWPQAVIYRRNVGKARDPRSGRVIQFGIAGQADIGVIIDGRAVEVECKSETGRQSKEQRRWQTVVERAGGAYLLARSADAAVSEIERLLS